MTINQRGFVAGGAWLCAGFALLLGCSARDSSQSPVEANQDDLRKSSPSRAPTHGRRGRPPQPGNGHGNGHGHGHGQGHGHGGHDDEPGHGVPGSGSGGSASSGGSSSSPGSGSGGSSSGGGSATAGSDFGGTYGGPPGVCGDSQWGNFEQCDDGNARSGDGCSSLCQLEPNYSCDFLGVPCQLVVCGDGRQQAYLLPDGTYAYEGCDDGNAVAGDGCDAACGVESGWICEQPGTACRRPVCGDSRQDAWFVAEPGQGGGSGGFGGGGPGGSYYYEECDDGNAASGDGCTSTCTIEAGWICSAPGEACHEPQCGDGIVDYVSNGGSGGAGNVGGAGGAGAYGYFESCDDGNTVPGDGCGATCSVEAGWNCDPWVGPCHRTVCGDGITDYPLEECDDGNTTSNDGCTSCRWDYQGGGGSGGGGSFGGTPSVGGSGFVGSAGSGGSFSGG